MRSPTGLALLLGATILAAPLPLAAEPAPARRAVIPADAAPEAMAGLFADLESGGRTIDIPGAAWLQLQFSDMALGQGRLTVTGETGESQTFTQAQIEAWGGLSAVFNGSRLQVTLTPGPDGAPATAKVADIIVGLPAAAPPAMRGLVGDDLDRFLPDDLRGAAPQGAAPEGAAPEDAADRPTPEAICGPTDDRTASNDPRQGRIMPVGCTGWMIDGGAFLTAGHCIGAATQMVEFNVPASLADGTTVAPAVRDQYRVDAGTIVTQNTGVGNDWAVFRVLPNTQTGLMPAAAQGATYQVSNTASPATVRITGYGVDGPAPAFGAGTSPRDATNQTQQTHAGALSENSGGPNLGVLRYNPDTQGGNSGSPVIVDGSTLTIGIHTNGGCTAAGGTNAGTSFRNAALWAAVTAANVRTADILWQHINGQVHYWPMAAGQRQGGVNIFTPVGADWRMVGAGDFNGDETEDVLWQHINGQVHFWPMANGQRQGGIHIFTPVGPDWKLIGAGDFNGDGTDDVLWQHINGQAHFWPMANGQRQGGVNIFTPVGPDWKIIGAGDFNGDGTDDVLWQHVFGQVHFWPMLNGQRQGGINVFTPVGRDWRIVGAGDFNADGTDDVLWQHVFGQVHFWPMLNGQRQGGINVFTPVGADWKLVGAGQLD